MASTLYPALYQVNTRVLITELSRAQGRSCTLLDLPDALLDQWAEQGFDWVWLLGIWQTGPAGREVSRTRPDLRYEYQDLLADFTDADVCGSPFAVQSYTADATLGGPDALAHTRERLAQRGMRLLLDFVPNHTALDHPWVEAHPEYYIRGTTADLARDPRNFCQRDTSRGAEVFAHGRDPYFPGWPDTLQLNYRHAGLRQAMIDVLKEIARQCDGVRCDMAMLLLPEVIQRTWGDLSLPADGSRPVDSHFWTAALPLIRQQSPGFLFMAEVYWDLEWTLQQKGFDHTYDKRHYDRIHARDPKAIRGHLSADMEFQRKSVHFLENHDEPRAASAFPFSVHGAAAALTYLVPGLRFFHEGQFEGRRLKASMHLNRRPEEPVDEAIAALYRHLLAVLKRPEIRAGRWQLLTPRQAWDENRSHERYVAFFWEGPQRQRLLVAVNYGPAQGQCYLPLPFSDLRGQRVILKDLMGTAAYERSGDSLSSPGLYLDLPEWGFHVFDVTI